MRRRHPRGGYSGGGPRDSMGTPPNLPTSAAQADKQPCCGLLSEVERLRMRMAELETLVALRATEEPTAFGARVIDGFGHQWVRVTSGDHLDCPWFDSDSYAVPWHELAPPVTVVDDADWGSAR